jgi:hypothetical protein
MAATSTFLIINRQESFFTLPCQYMKKGSPMTSKQTVFTIDDEGIRDGLEMLLESMGQESRSFASGHDFLVA